jgi:TRAP-type C4-dicarboxylate transport system permease small subunit
MVTQWYMPSLIFFTIGYVEYHREHITSQYLTDKMPEFWKRVFIIFGTVLMLIMMSMLGWYGLQVAINAFQAQEFHEEVFKIVIWPMKFYVPIGSWAFCLQLLVHIIEDSYSIIRMRRTNG